ncbi:MAG TPA: NAD-dependent epimerase/dehydratase family protein [Sphingobacterium sp.]|nr:NAD-dependent epimerase/dehydratase family protein [Sphingobacterium sp.]
MKILILGCGWVGEEFAQKMAQEGAELWVTTTSSDDKAARLEKLGYHVQCVDFDCEPDILALPTSFDYVLTSIPATSRHSVEVLSKRFVRVRALIDALTYRKHIFLSSVGIYPDQNGVFDERYTVELNDRLHDAEQIMQASPNTVIYRLGGLFGKNRVFARYFANKICTTGDQLANFVHVDDVVQLIYLGFHDLYETGIYNVVCPLHPRKKDVILASALKYHCDMPSQFEPKDNFQKKVVSDKIIGALNYRFKFASPLDF